MIRSYITFTQRLLLGGATILATSLLVVQAAGAQITPLPEPDPQPGSYGLEATKRQPPPTEGATITTPGMNASFSESPVTVTGICPTGLLVQVYNNGVMSGAVMCENASFSIEISLFVGTNELQVLVFDDLEQAGPASNQITITYANTSFSAFRELITLTSNYGRRSVPAGNQLSWPLQVSGGTGPYAFSIDWNDGSSAELKSQSLAGLMTMAHTYSKAGIYRINVRVTDVNGVSAFLQLIAVSSGQVEDEEVAAAQIAQQPRILWVPLAASLLLLVPAYWLGRRSQLVTLKNKMLKERDDYMKQQK